MWEFEKRTSLGGKTQPHLLGQNALTWLLPHASNWSVETSWSCHILCEPSLGLKTKNWPIRCVFLLHNISPLCHLSRCPIWLKYANCWLDTHNCSAPRLSLNIFFSLILTPNFCGLQAFWLATKKHKKNTERYKHENTAKKFALNVTRAKL